MTFVEWSLTAGLAIVVLWNYLTLRMLSGLHKVAEIQDAQIRHLMERD